MKERRIPKWVYWLAGLLVVLFLLRGWFAKKPVAAGPPPAPVIVDLVKQQNVPVQLHAVGNVQPFTSVTVKSLVSGPIVQIHFKEGQDVKKGDLLFTIDPRPYEAAVKQAQANLDKDMAQSVNAQKDAVRAQDLVKKGAIAAQQNDQTISNAISESATIRGDQAALDTAKLLLEYASIRSPIDGRTGAVLIHEGNLVKANDDASILVVINQIHPIYVQFSLPEQNLEDIRSHKKDGELEVMANPPNQQNQISRGLLTLVDNAVDQTTGTVKLKATFPNEDEALWPGEFVNTTLTLAQDPNALTVPAKAVQPGQKGQYVFVVKPDQTAEMRLVDVARMEGPVAVIAKGVQAGEKIVVDGQIAVRPGGKIQVKPASDAGGTPTKPSQP
ncbi:MAG: efflux RND transporter periplasmic adaptor subunit [Spartobacteria bacterium]